MGVVARIGEGLGSGGGEETVVIIGVEAGQPGGSSGPPRMPEGASDGLEPAGQRGGCGIDPVDRCPAERAADDRHGRLIGRTKAALNTTLHAVTDARGRPLRFVVTAGQVSDCTGAAARRDACPLRTGSSPTAATIPTGSGRR